MSDVARWRRTNPLALAVLVLLFEGPNHPYELARTAKTQAQKQMLSDLSQHWLDQAIALERPQGFPGEEGLPPSPRLPSMWPTRPGKP